MTIQSAAQAFRALLEVAVDAVIIIDHRGHIETFNHAAEKLFGYTAAEVLGANVSLLMPEPHRSNHDGYLERYLSSGVAHIIGIGREIDARRKDGSLFPASLAVGRIPDCDPPRFVGFLHDITLRRQALASAQSARDLAEQYLELAQVILLAVDAQNHITLINRKGCETFGQSAEAILGRNWLENFVVEEDRGVIHAKLQRLAAEPARTTYECECRIRSEATGAHRLIAWRGVALRDRQGNVTGALCSGEDVTDSRRAAEEELRTQQRMTHISRLATMGEMAGGIAHELNQPLAAIANYAVACERLLAAPTPAIAEVQGALQQIAGQALRAGEIIRRLRALVRTREARREPVEINELVSEMLALAQSDARLNGVRLLFEPTSGLPRVNADGLQIQQVLLNLIRNAIEALMGHSGEREVIVRTARTGQGEVEISVDDTGPGVDPAVAPTMFEAFRTTKEQGTGLGLAISRSIIEAHRGRLEHRSSSSAGACFYLTLPALQENEA